MQMARKYNLEILAVAAIIVFGILFLYTSLIMKNAEFAGTDDIAAAGISGSSECFVANDPTTHSPMGSSECRD